MRSHFITTIAFLGRIDGETRCAFWAEEPTEHGFDPSRLVSVDLSLTPSAAARGEISWDAVQVDDSTVSLNGTLAGTTIGPRWPEMQLGGVVLLEATFWERAARAGRLTCPPAGASGHDYEYQTVVYWPHRSDPRAGRRYTGFHAEILETRGTLARVAVHAAGGAARGAKPSVCWIDLASPEECDVGPGSLTRIGVEGGPKTGALFLATGTVGAGAVKAPEAAPERHGPKLPPWASDNASPKLPPWASDSAGPKIPPWASESAGPKIPPYQGDSAGPKIPPYQGEAAGPKIPIALGSACPPGALSGYME